MSTHRRTGENRGRKSKLSRSEIDDRNTNVQVGDWLLLKNGTLTASSLLRETWQEYSESSDDRQITITCTATNEEHQHDIVLPSNALRLLVPQLIPPESAGNRTTLRTRAPMIDVIDDFVHVRDIDISQFPTRFLVYSKEYNFEALYYAHLEYIVNTACDRRSSLPEFLEKHTEVLQVLGEYLPAAFLAHVARRIITEFDEQTCSEEHAPLLWKQGRFRSRNRTTRFHTSIWELLEAVDVGEVMFHYASGLHLNALGRLLNFMMVNCVSERARESGNESWAGQHHQWLHLFRSIEWCEQKQAARAVLEYSADWAAWMQTAVMESVDRAAAAVERTDVQHEDVTMWIQIPRKQRARKTLWIGTVEMFEEFVGRVELGVHKDCLFLEVSMWPENIVEQSLMMDWSLDVSVSVRGVEAFCLCNSTSVRQGFSWRSWPVLSRDSYDRNKMEYDVQFSEGKRRLRKKLLLSLEDQWFDVHSKDCWLIVNVRVSQRS